MEATTIRPSWACGGTTPTNPRGGEGYGGQGRTEECHALWSAAIGQSSGQRRSKRTSGSCKAKRSGRGATEPETGVQHDGERRPERTEGNGQQTLGNSRAAQGRMLRPESEHGAEQGAVAQ